MSKADIAVVGLAVMGENLILNMESKGFTVACYNRTIEKVDQFINGRAKGKKIIGCHSIEELCANLKTPRKIMVMVKAGKPVDDFIDQVLDHIEDGDMFCGAHSCLNTDMVPQAHRRDVDVPRGIAELEDVVKCLRGSFIMRNGNDVCQ